MASALGLDYPNVMRTQAECDAIGRAITTAFPKFKAHVSDRRFYLDADSRYAEGYHVHFYDPSARCPGNSWSYPLLAMVSDAYERRSEAVAAIFVRILCELQMGNSVGALIANQGLDVDCLADLMIKAGLA